MLHSLPSPDLHLLIAEADAAARRLRYKLGLSAPDREDLRQDLLVHLIGRLPAFDPSRGSLGAFAGVVLRHHSGRIAMRIYRQRRRQGGALLSLDTASECGRSLADATSEDRGMAGWTITAADCSDRRIDLSAALSRLDPAEQTVCAAIATSTIDRLKERGFGSRAKLYRHLHGIRCTLTAYGFRLAA